MNNRESHMDLGQKRLRIYLTSANKSSLCVIVFYFIILCRKSMKVIKIIIA